MEVISFCKHLREQKKKGSGLKQRAPFSTQLDYPIDNRWFLPLVIRPRLILPLRHFMFFRWKAKQFKVISGDMQTVTRLVPLKMTARFTKTNRKECCSPNSWTSFDIFLNDGISIAFDFPPQPELNEEGAAHLLRVGTIGWSKFLPF